MTNHQLWLDTLNMAQQQGKPLSEALAIADNQRERWPFKYVNGLQTFKSEALERDKKQHKRQRSEAKTDVSDFEDAPL